jgi:hypothetical protein
VKARVMGVGPHQQQPQEKVLLARMLRALPSAVVARQRGVLRRARLALLAMLNLKQPKKRLPPLTVTWALLEVLRARRKI